MEVIKSGMTHIAATALIRNRTQSVVTHHSSLKYLNSERDDFGGLPSFCSFLA